MQVPAQDVWLITLPDGKVLTFPDWESARIEAAFLSSVHGVVLIPELAKTAADEG